MSRVTSVDGGPADVQRLGASFRDPSGFVYERDGVLLRQVSRSFADTYDRFIESGCYDALVAEGLLVPHEEVDLSLAATDDAHRVLRPARLPFVSHPYEWCPGQRRDAALATLRAQTVALDHGMSLRDASAFNVQFTRGRPVLIDTLSFEPYEEGRPWVAYRQFCQHFLAPLALETIVDVRLGRLLETHIDGVPLDLASELLPLRTKLRPGLLTHLHGQASASRRTEVRPGAAPRTARFSERAMRGLVEGLRGTVGRLTWDPSGTTWADYYTEAGHYADEAMAEKEATVARWLERVSPGTVWDLGANTGRFSRLAAVRGAHTVAWDVDHGAVERAWSEVREGVGGGPVDVDHTEGEMLPLVLDLTTPTPAIGWALEERPSLVDRAGVDLVLALALVHHLAIGNNVPLDRVADLLADLGDRAVVEWVPKSDPKVEVLLATREDVFAHYDRDGFEQAIAGRFEVEDHVVLPGAERELYLLRVVAGGAEPPEAASTHGAGAAPAATPER